MMRGLVVSSSNNKRIKKKGRREKTNSTMIGVMQKWKGSLD
jgi:hypothetical protein